MAERSLRPELSELLSRLRRQIRRYVVIEGTALVLAVLGALFWLSLAVDHAWFQLSRLELPYWFHAGFDVTVAGLVGFLAVSWIGLRLVRSFRSRALALVLERRFPELDDRLVTAVELAESNDSPGSELTEAMMSRTIDQAVEASRRIDLHGVFDRRPLQRAVLAAAVMVASIGGLAAASQTTVLTWMDSFLNLDDEYWNREYGLIVRVIAQPGDIVREFDGLNYRHPRGADLTLLIEAAEGFKVPERVQLKYRIANGRGQGTVLCSPVGDRQFRHSLSGLLDDVEFRVYGGDFVNRRPFHIEVVEPPQLDGITLACNCPAYTDRKHPDSTPENPKREIVPVRGTQVAIPDETEFLLTATANKPLIRVRIQFGNHELTFGRSGNTSSAEFVERSDEGVVLSRTEPDAVDSEKWLSPDGRHLSVPFVMSRQETDAARTRIESINTEARPPFVLPPDTNLRIYLEDSDGILTAEPARVLISGITDKEPGIETRLRGIGTSITRKASIPVIARLTDDYGIADARLEFQIDDDEEWSRRDLETGLPQSAGPPTQREFVFKRNDKEEYERFRVRPLDLSIGQRLVVSVAAQDADNLNGPHVTRSERYSFKIVSSEELQSLLYQRELNLRAQFHRIITESRGLQQDLIRHRARVDERKRLQRSLDESSDAGADATDKEDAGTDTGTEDSPKQRIRDIYSAVLACAERSLHAVRKNANETASVELSFRDIREELVNNAVHTPQTLERLDDRIVKPLHSIVTQDYPAVDEALGLFRLANERGNDPTGAIDNSVELLASMIARMERILAEMEQLKDFQKSIEELKQIIKEQEALLERTKKENIRLLLPF
jgi:hypothetical protein